MNSIENFEYSKKYNKGSNFVNSKIKNEFLHKNSNINSNMIKEETSKNSPVAAIAPRLWGADRQ